MALVTSSLNGNAVKYDDTEFEVLKEAKNVYLHYVGDGSNITNPKGNTSCYRMFEDFEGTNLDLLNFDTSNVTNMNNMFSDCKSLENLNLSRFNTKNVVNMSGMFFNCEKLEYLDISSFNTNNVKTTNCMFMDCKNLKELDLSNFSISNVKTMDYMFFGCCNLVKLDVSSFKFTGDKIVNYMFWACTNLKELKVDNQFYQFFVDNYYLLFKNKKKTKIIPVSKLDRAVNDLFY